MAAFVMKREDVIVRTGKAFGGISATHSRWHLLRGKFVEGCMLCRAAGREKIESGLQDRNQEQGKEHPEG
jgi:hypothetical protein